MFREKIEKVINIAGDLNNPSAIPRKEVAGKAVMNAE